MPPIFLSEIQKKPIWDAQGERVGRCVDVLVRGVGQPFPLVCALALRDGADAPRFIAAEQVGWLRPSILLTTERSKLSPYEPQGDELWLARQVLDRQIVDVDGRRVVRVNDLQLARVGEHLCLVGADVGTMGLLRRLGVEHPIRALFSALRRRPPEAVIPWEDVAPLQADAPIRLRVSRERIGKLHPADIAAIVSDLDRRTGQALIEALDDETLADTLEESPAELQVAVLNHLKPERAADILEKMGPDEAADLLADLPEQTIRRLLELMEEEDAADVRRLLAYPEDSAGGIMTTEFATVPEGLTAGQALDYLRRSEAAQEDEALYYIYITDQAGRLKGVLSLRDLVMCAPEVPLANVAETKPVTADLYTPQREVAHLVAKYDLLAVPVVDEEGVLHGIVTVDDAIDAFIPTAWKKRLPRFF
ncbi:MAG TPA: magnesium transporter [Thermoflexia bacterium]|nr:MAG: magnesium transporter MgtE [Chloroflexota bacterium]HEY66854.1 magnesium transporter [Thermoflexia bacterium]